MLEAHPDVLEAAVLGRADPQWGERVTAIVVPRPGHGPGGRDAARALRPRAGSLQGPRQIVLAREPLARTPSGKLLRSELR